MRPATFEAEQIIEAGLPLLAGKTEPATAKVKKGARNPA